MESTDSVFNDHPEYDVNNEVAIALALVNQRPLSSLTEYQREKVRQLRAGVATETNSGSTTKLNDIVTSPTPKPGQITQSKMEPPSVIIQKKEAGDKILAEIPVANTSGNVQKISRKMEFVPGKNTIVTDPHDKGGPNSRMHVTKQQMPTGTKCDPTHEDPLNTINKKVLKNKEQIQAAKEDGINTEKKLNMEKKMHHRKSPQYKKTAAQNIGTRKVATKQLSQKQKITVPKQQIVTKSQLKSLNKRILRKVPSPGQLKPSAVQAEAAELSKVPSNDTIPRHDSKPRSSSMHTQSPHEVHHGATPVLQAMATPAPDHSEQQESSSHFIEAVKTDKEESKSYPTEWVEPETPGETPPLLLSRLERQEQQQLPVATLPAVQNFKEDIQQSDIQQLSNDEKAHALIHYAQGLVINDFLASQKRGLVNTIPSYGHSTAHTTLTHWESCNEPTQWETEFIGSKRNEPQIIKTRLLSPIYTPPVNDTPNFTPLPDRGSAEMKLLQSSPVHHHDSSLLTAYHQPVLRGTKAWQSMNNILPPRMIDTSVQTDSIDSEDDFSMTSSIVLLPPESVRGLQRPQNPGGNSRPPGKSDRRAIREARKEKSNHEHRENGLKRHRLNNDKHLLNKDDKKPIKVSR